ncbi:MAG: DUF1624 domain-containing protein [Asticcacaulis sp.]|nr:DUF1624 domain-containing protein [Asticcacaulis sp.]
MTEAGAAVRAEVKAGQRLSTIDVLRGLIIVIMVIDHVRDYVHISGYGVDAIDFRQSNPILFGTRWITHLCAPTFIFLAGVSAWLQHVKGKDTPKLSRFLVTRGLWLIVLELTITGFGWNFSIPMLPFLAILWAIGWAMIALAGLVFLPRMAVLAIGVAIIAGHNLLDGVNAAQFGQWGFVWNFLFEVKVFTAGGHPVVALFYPVLPWIGVIALGYGMGDVFLSPNRNRTLLLTGLGLLVLFLILRATNLYGDPRPWAVQANLASSVMDFLNVAKYPPSLLYVCATLGVVLSIAPLLDRLPVRVSGFFRTIGSVPLMAYLAHLYIMHIVAIIAHLVAGKSLTGQFDTIRIIFTNPQAMNGTGLPLWVTYLCWAIVVAAIYPICVYWSGLKRRRKDWWLSYL